MRTYHFSYVRMSQEVDDRRFGMFTTMFSQWTPLFVMCRILCTIILGTLIGIDRGTKRRGGGARTNVTVCVGATLIMLLEQ